MVVVNVYGVWMLKIMNGFDELRFIKIMSKRSQVEMSYILREMLWIYK